LTRKTGEVRSGKTDLYDAFKKSEKGFLYEVITSYENKVAVKYCKDITDDYLPVRGCRLSTPECSSDSTLKPEKNLMRAASL
ncbi:MAG: hypothetical protein GY795_35090, partial [Desulfobacterales bacterium]|nr:hypothetical protein [Desulfobacterales bacterium]